MESQRQGARVTQTSFSKYLKVNVTLLRIFGLLPLPANATLCDKAWDILRVLVIPGMINIVVIPNVLTLFNEHLDVDIITESLSGCTESGGLQIKYIILFFRRDKLKELIVSCQNLWETNHPRGYGILSRYVKRGYILTWVFLCVLNVTATCFAILPFLIKSSSASQALPVSPGFVINSALVYKIAACGQCVVIYICGFIVTAVDGLLPVLLINSCGQFELIRAMLEDINEMYETVVTDQNPNEDFEVFFRTNINECIVRHQRLLAHYRKIEENFNLYSLVQMFIGLYTIALGLFNLSMGTAGAFRYVTILMTGIAQILICNWTPEMVLEESDVTNLAVYNLPWYRGHCYSRSTTSFFLIMMQRPVKLTAGKFTVLSMRTFSAILTQAMSFVTLLNTVT